MGAISDMVYFLFTKFRYCWFFTRNVTDMAIVSDATFGYDTKDATSHESLSKDIYKNIDNITTNTKFDISKSYWWFTRTNKKHIMNYLTYWKQKDIQ